MPAGIVLIIGPPAVGKTTLAKTLENTATFAVHRWTLDDHPNSNCLKDKNDTISELVRQNPYQINLIDDTMHLRSMRKRYISISRKMNIGIAIINLSDNLENCIARNNARESPIAETDVISVYKKSESPDGPFEQQYLLESKCHNWDAILIKLEETRLFHLSLTLIPKETGPESAAHLLNIVLNRAVNTILLKVSDKKSVAHQLTAAKRAYFEEQKNNLQPVVKSKVLDSDVEYFISILKDTLS